jgi:hypothetical protein
MFGSVTNPANENLPDLNGREYATLVPLMMLAFWIGLYPAPLFRVLDQPVQQLVERYDPHYYQAPAIDAATVHGSPVASRTGSTSSMEPAMVSRAGRALLTRTANTALVTTAAEKRVGN